VLAIPSCARVACWLNAWVARRESADEVIDGLLNGQARVEFVEPVQRQVLPPALVLGELSRLGVRRVSASLPTPGDLTGLGGPAAFNADALEAGEAVIWHEAAVGFVPVSAGASTSWRGSVASPPTYLPDVGTADRDLRHALIEAARTLAALDVASWNPDVADALLNLRADVLDAQRLPFASPLAARTATTAIRCAQIVDLAFSDDGGALSSRQVDQRRDALVPLRRAARTAVVSACSSVDGR
jgi:hypothetical protein